MSDEELVEAFMRLRRRGDATLLQVATVCWHGPHSPHLRWRTFHTWATEPSPSEVAEAQCRALDDPKFFNICVRCGERCNAGHMHDDQICQSCAEQYLHVVY